MLLGVILPKLEKSGFDPSKYMASGRQGGTGIHGSNCRKLNVGPLVDMPLSSIGFKCTQSCQASLWISRDGKSEVMGDFTADMLDKVKKAKLITKMGPIDSCEKAIDVSASLKETFWRSSELSEAWWEEATSELRAEVREKLRGPFNLELKQRAARRALSTSLKDSLLLSILEDGIKVMVDDTRQYLVHFHEYRKYGSAGGFQGAISLAYEHPSGFLVDVPRALTLHITHRDSVINPGQRVLTAKTPPEETLEALKVIFNPGDPSSPYSSLSAALKACRRL